jgi:hypothetical protein
VIVGWSSLRRADWVHERSRIFTRVSFPEELALLLLALRSQVHGVMHSSKLFRPFEEPSFSALPLFVSSRWIEKPVQLSGSQVESLRSSFLDSRLDWRQYCERLLEETANGFRAGQLSILTRNPSIQNRKLGRL